MPMNGSAVIISNGEMQKQGWCDRGVEGHMKFASA